MIRIDISNVWGELSLPDLLSVERDITAAHRMLSDGSGPGGEWLGWMNLPTYEETEVMRRISAAARRIRASSEAFVVVGIGGSCLGAQAAIELLYGPDYNLKRGTKGNPRIFFTGNSLSTRAWNDLMEELEGKDLSVVYISKSGTTTEPAIATRALRWLMERRYGTDEARRRTYAVTDPCSGVLLELATREGWETFAIPPDVGGRFSVLTPVGLLPMAVAGIRITDVMMGAARAKKDYDLRSFENPAWLYAAIRVLMHQRGKQIELLTSFEPAFRAMGAWWQLLFGESEGKDGKGLFPAAAEFTADLHSLGQLIQQGRRNLFETVLRFAPSRPSVTVGPDARNLDGLNYLTGRTLDYIEEQAFRGAVSAHADGGVPVVTMELGEINAMHLGEVFYFFQLCCGLSAYALGVNPFDQPGLELYKENMFRLLGRPGYDLM